MAGGWRPFGISKTKSSKVGKTPKRKKQYSKYEAGGHIAGLMNTRGEKPKPTKISRILRGGLPSLGKRR